VTDLYEAGDINQTGGGGGDDFDDDADYDEGDEGVDAEEGNRVSSIDGGTPLAVLTYLARSLSNDPDAV